MAVGTLLEAGLRRSRIATGLMGAGGEALERARELSIASGQLAVEGAKVVVRSTPDVALTVIRDAMRRVGIIEPEAPTPEEQYRTRLDTFQSSMALRVEEYERDYANRKRLNPTDFKLQRKMGTLRDSLFDDARKWMEIAREEEDPGPAAGTSEQDRINNIAACAVGWGLSHYATELLVADLHEYFELAIPVGGAHDDTPKLGSMTAQ